MIELLNIDCMEYMATCEDNAFDLAIVDPPYGNNISLKNRYGNKSHKAIHSKNNKYFTVVNRTEFIPKNWDRKTPSKEYFNELKRVSKNQIIFGVNYFNVLNLAGGRIVWDKVNGLTSFSDCEIAYCSFHKSIRLIQYMWNGMMQGESILNGTKQQGNKKLNEIRIHPTQKPLALYKWIMINYAKPGQRILDTHLGSGSSAIAAHYFGCDFVGCEIDKEYYDAMMKRFKRETSQIAMFEGI